MKSNDKSQVATTYTVTGDRKFYYFLMQHYLLYVVLMLHSSRFRRKHRTL